MIPKNHESNTLSTQGHGISHIYKFHTLYVHKHARNGYVQMKCNKISHYKDMAYLISRNLYTICT